MSEAICLTFIALAAVIGTQNDCFALGSSIGKHYLANSGKDYELFNTKATYEDAKYACQTHGAGRQLASVETSRNNIDLSATIGSQLKDEAWTSGRKFSALEDELITWTSAGTTSNYTNWADPSYKKMPGCVYVKGDVFNGMVWHIDSTCATERFVICQSPQ